jgi:ABC-type multidrug transport system fused ATPase/permease subunit
MLSANDFTNTQTYWLMKFLQKEAMTHRLSTIANADKVVVIE